MTQENRNNEPARPKYVTLQFTGEGMWNLSGASGVRYFVSDGEHNRVISVLEEDVPQLLEQGKFNILTENYKVTKAAAKETVKPDEIKS